MEHSRDCDCLIHSRPYLAEFVTHDELGPALLDEHLRHLRSLDPNGVERKKNHWASNALFSCVRKVWLQYHDAEATNDAGNTDVLALGELVEEKMVEKYMLSGNFIRGQKYIEFHDPRLKLPITGKVDALIAEGGDVVPLEIKSIKNWGEFKGTEVWQKLLPRAEHVAQLTVYLKALNLPRGYVEYFNKNRSLRARYEVKFSQQFFDEVIGRFAELEAELPRQEPPIPKGFREGSYPCGWYAKDGSKELVGSCAF